jgi:hypothetical protein
MLFTSPIGLRSAEKAACTHLFFRLELVLDLRAEDGKEDATAERQAENLRVDEVFDALHLPLGEAAGGDFRDDFHDEIAVEVGKSLEF